MRKSQKKIGARQLTWDCKCLEAEGTARSRKHFLSFSGFWTFASATLILCMLSSTNSTAAVMKKVSEFLHVTMQVLLPTAVTVKSTQANHLGTMTYSGWTDTYLQYFPDILSIKKSRNFHSWYWSILLLSGVCCSCAQKSNVPTFPVPWKMSHIH